jgi:uncharacterized membrane protein
MKASTLFTKEQQAQILAAVSEVERNTSGEIRIHIEASADGDVLDRAAWLFSKLGMQKTELRNGVLFYLALENKKFAVIGDAGINSKVPPDFWDKTKETLQNHFREGKFTEGLISGVLMAGNQLKKHFPRLSGDVNELPDDISFDNPV